MLGVLQHLNSVHENIFHSDCVLMRGFVSRFVSNRFGIEDYHVGEISFLKKATMVEAEVCSRQAAQATHRFLKRNNFFFAHILTEDAGKVTIGAWVRR